MHENSCKKRRPVRRPDFDPGEAKQKKKVNGLKQAMGIVNCFFSIPMCPDAVLSLAGDDVEVSAAAVRVREKLIRHKVRLVDLPKYAKGYEREWKELEYKLDLDTQEFYVLCAISLMDEGKICN